MEKLHESHRYIVTQDIIAKTLGLLTLIPLAPFINQFIPPLLVEGWNVDLVLAFVVSGLFIRLLMWIFQPLIFPAFILLCGYLIYGSVTSRYGFKKVFNDYKTMVTGNWITKDEKQLDILNVNPESFSSYTDKTVKGIKRKLNSNDSAVRNFAVKHSLEYFDEYYIKYGQIVRPLSLFRYINENFKYVMDNRRDEYFAAPQETILNGLGGDCDDHSILMASAMGSIGARSRIILIKGHAYPELFIGDKKAFDHFKQAVVQLFQAYDIKNIFYHAHDNEYWINLDYTERYPGGRYMNGEVYAVIE